MKTLRTQKRYLVIVYNLFSTLPPSKVQTLDDMELIQDEIKPKLKEACGEFVEVLDTINEKQREFTRKVKEIKEKQLDKEKENAEIEKIRSLVQKDLDELSFKLAELDQRDDVAEVSFDSKTFNLLFELVSENLKTMFKTIEDTVNFRKDLVSANNKKEEKKE